MRDKNKKQTLKNIRERILKDYDSSGKFHHEYRFSEPVVINNKMVMLFEFQKSDELFYPTVWVVAERNGKFKTYKIFELEQVIGFDIPYDILRWNKPEYDLDDELAARYFTSVAHTIINEFFRGNFNELTHAKYLHELNKFYIKKGNNQYTYFLNK